jgi:hypothetical protein
MPSHPLKLRQMATVIMTMRTTWGFRARPKKKLQQRRRKWPNHIVVNNKQKKTLQH